MPGYNRLRSKHEPLHAFAVSFFGILAITLNVPGIEDNKPLPQAGVALREECISVHFRIGAAWRWQYAKGRHADE